MKNDIFLKVNNSIIKNIPLSSLFRRSILVALDLFIIYLSICITLLYYPSEAISAVSSPKIILLFFSSFALPIYIFTGQYKGLTKFITSNDFYKIAARNIIIIIPFLIIISFFSSFKLPLLAWLMFFLILTSLSFSVRIVLRNFLLRMSFKDNRNGEIYNVIIYASGLAGAELINILPPKYKINAFLDESSHLWGRTVKGIPIVSPDELSRFTGKVDQVWLSMPHISLKRKREIVDQIKELGLNVLSLPSLEDITSGKAKIENVRPINIQELLCRNPVPPDQALLTNAVKGLNVCVAGAGGSIGKELCRQILSLNPNKIILLERSEPSLYSIHHELTSTKNLNNIDIIPILGCATDEILVDRVLGFYQIDFVINSAAYKHVPLVESNPIQGISNNYFSTKTLCKYSLKHNVKKFIFISTDKAVRPTNVMGASKRLSEILVQGFANKSIEASNIDNKCKTIFSIVRFGNVLGSSGSVVPLFRKQIANGGPVTITHKDVIRYFMTISEAALLVLQASVLAEGGDVFLLDMGEPVKIIELAKLMIKLSGMSVKNEFNNKGDIAIEITGLRAGEKIFEELLINDTAEKTEHQLIFRSKDEFITIDNSNDLLDKIEDSLIKQDKEKTYKFLNDIVPEWKPFNK